MAHTLTFTSGLTCTVNGTSVSSGYTLNNGDIIVLNSAETYYIIGVNGIDPTSETMSLSDTDIIVTAQHSGGTND